MSTGSERYKLPRRAKFRAFVGGDSQEGTCVVLALSSHSYIAQGAQISGPCWVVERESDGECMLLAIEEITFIHNDAKEKEAGQN